MLRWLAAVGVVLSLACGASEAPPSEPEPEPAADPQPSPPEPAAAPDRNPTEEPAEPGLPLGPKMQACTDQCIEGRQAEAKAADVIASECTESCQKQCVEDCVKSRMAEATAPEQIRMSCASGCK